MENVMTSRSIQKEARAYMDEYGVPYTEALRRVRESREDRSPGMRQLVFTLGAGVFPETGFDLKTRAPVCWSPGTKQLPGDGAGSLCVYGHRDGSVSRSLYLSTLVRGSLASSPAVIFTERPDLFPVRDNISFVDPAIVQAIMNNTEGPEESPFGSAERAHEYFKYEDPEPERVFVYDLTPCPSASDEYLDALLDCDYAALLYSSADLDSEGAPVPLLSRFSTPDNERTINEVTVYLGPMMAEGYEFNNWTEHRDYNVKVTLHSGYTAHTFVE